MMTTIFAGKIFLIRSNVPANFAFRSKVRSTGMTRINIGVGTGGGAIAEPPTHAIEENVGACP